MSDTELTEEPLRIYRLCSGKEERQKRVFELMDTVGIARRFANSYPHELDGGRRQRIGVARALSLDPKFVVCDEPVSALDVSIQAQVLNLLQDLQKDKGLTYMFITHDLSVVKHISNNICVMYMGTVVEKSEAKELFRNPKHPYTKALLSAIPRPVVDRSRKRFIIKGEVTSPIEPKPGCRFAPRCEFATEHCSCASPALVDDGSGHACACFAVNGEGSQA
jgi:peptide/nickel transport system ATP-binding protein